MKPTELKFAQINISSNLKIFFGETFERKTVESAGGIHGEVPGEILKQWLTATNSKRTTMRILKKFKK